MNSSTISICIPTHGRSKLLLEALQSAVDQTRLPNEIVVSDDVGSEEVRGQVTGFAMGKPVTVRYVHCTTGPGQVANVNNCLREAKSDLIVLLHDDDLLTPKCIELLTPCLEQHPDVVGAYGKQIFVTNAGEFIASETDFKNRGYRRSAEYAGVQADSILSGIWQQFPNDGYLVRADVAREVLYRADYGAATDFDFGLRLAERGKFYYVDEFTAKYRNSDESVTRGPNWKSDDSAYQGMRILLGTLKRYPNYEPEIKRALCNLAPMGLIMAANRGQLDEAIKLYFGPYHRGRIFTPGGIKRGINLLKLRLGVAAT
jgi:glycosyltransferase involved in cell wall biosynthesis